MRQYQSTDQFRPTMLTQGPVVGATIDGTSADAGWYRLLPDGVTAARPSMDELTLNNLRPDITAVNLVDWKVYIVNTDHFQERRIINVNADTIQVKPVFDLGEEANPLGSTDIRYILMPQLLNALNVHFDEGSDGNLEIGVPTEFIIPGASGYSREIAAGDTVTATMKTIAVLPAGTALECPSRYLRSIFYRYTNASNDNKIRWGNYLIQ